MNASAPSRQEQRKLRLYCVAAVVLVLAGVLAAVLLDSFVLVVAVAVATVLIGRVLREQLAPETARSLDERWRGRSRALALLLFTALLVAVLIILLG